QIPVRGEAFDRGDICAISLDREHRARLRGLPVYQHCARAADRGFATHVRAGQAQQVAQVMDEKQTRLDLVAMFHAVHTHGDGFLHGSTPVFRQKSAETGAYSNASERLLKAPRWADFRTKSRSPKGPRGNRAG